MMLVDLGFDTVVLGGGLAGVGLWLTLAFPGAYFDAARAYEANGGPVTGCFLGSRWPTADVKRAIWSVRASSLSSVARTLNIIGRLFWFSPMRAWGVVKFFRASSYITRSYTAPVMTRMSALC